MIEVQHLFRPLDQALIELLKSLGPEDWDKPTVAGSWTVKDVVAHLLDGNVRGLSIQKERYFGEHPPPMEGYQDLVQWLNALNRDWVQAMKRVSPNMLIVLHQATGPSLCDYFESLNLRDTAIFAVDWAGESESLNWMHLAREYTEKWHHQQQVRDATDRPGIMKREFFFPLMDTYMRALPRTFRHVLAPTGTVVEASVDDLGTWFIQKGTEVWELVASSETKPTATVQLKPDVAWKLFSKNIRRDDIQEGVHLGGDRGLAGTVLEMVSVMA